MHFHTTSIHVHAYTNIHPYIHMHTGETMQHIALTLRRIRTKVAPPAFTNCRMVDRQSTRKIESSDARSSRLLFMVALDIHRATDAHQTPAQSRTCTCIHSQFPRTRSHTYMYRQAGRQTTRAQRHPTKRRRTEYKTHTYMCMCAQKHTHTNTHVS